MSLELEKNCPCVKTSCVRRGNCVACNDNHNGKDKPSFCKRPEATVGPEHAERVNARLRAAGRLV